MRRQMADQRAILLLLLLLKRRLSRKRKRMWVRKINQARLCKGEYHSLIREMRLRDHESYFKYFRMTPSRFDHLLSLVGPAIIRQETNFRKPVSPGERLAVTIRYLTTGDSMQTIAFSFRLGHSTMCEIIDDTCDAIWKVVSVDYLRTPSTKQEWKRMDSILSGISQTVLER